VTWEAIGEPKLEVAMPTELSSLASEGLVTLGLGSARTLRFTCELPEGPPVVRLLAYGDRVLAIRAPDPERRQQVELIDAEGAHLRTITGLHGDWSLDERGAMLLGRTQEAELAAWSLDEPQRLPILVFSRLNGRELDMLRFLGGRHDGVEGTLVAVTRQAKALGGPPPDVLVDVLQISGYEDVSRWRSLRSRTRVAERICEGINRVIVGFDPAGLILAHERELWWGDWYLRERARLDPGPDVLPLLIAARGDGSSWMLTEREGRTELWHIAVGRCEQALVISEQLVDARALLVAPDDAAVIVGSSEVACLDADGALRWTFARAGAATGLIDTSGVALYSDGGALICTDPVGGRATVWVAPGSIGRIGPLAATGSRLWAGAGRFVFGLG
jgi:hypothetical protein